jgi:hypothetical protein
VSQVVEHLPTKHEALHLTPTSAKKENNKRLILKLENESQTSENILK